MSFAVREEFRQRWSWAVCWDGGKAICRADTENDAKRIAYALNRQRDRAGLNDPLTAEEIAAVKRALGK